LPVTALARSLDGSVWVATVSGYRMLNRGGRVFKLKDDGSTAELGTYPWAQDSHRTKITALWEDRQGRVWVGTYGGGMFHWLAGDGWQRLTTEGPLAQLIVALMMEDQEGSLWTATQQGGLHRVRPRKVTAVRLPPAAAENFILSACASRDGSVWVGTDGAGIFRYRHGQFEQQTNGLESLQVGVLFEDSRTNLWAGTWTGLYRWTRERFEPVTGAAAFRAVVLALTEDHQGSLWVCTGNGLVRLRDGEAKVFGNNEGIQHFYLRAVVEDAEGRICVASMDRGLYRQAGDRFEEVAPGKWSGATLIRALFADTGGALWIATYGDGLFRLKDGRFRHWTTADGLPDNMLHSVIEDADANLWFSSDNGIFGFPKWLLEQYQPGGDRPVLCWHLTTADGLETKVCSGAGQPVATRSADGRLWFPNQRSLAVFEPRGVPAGARMWPTLVEEVVVDGVPRLPNGSQPLAVSSGARRLEVHYTSPNLVAPERLRFRHRLAGLEEDWVEAGDRRVVFFNHLPPGHYEFQVTAGGADGRWHESPGVLKLEVIPRLWERRSTQAAAALVLLAGVAGIVWTIARARLRRRLQRLELQQALENERRRIAQDLHDDIGTGLTEVVLLTEPTEQESRSFAALKDQMDLAASKARQLISDMKLVVWTVNPENDLLPNLGDFLSNYAQEFLESTPIHCRLDLPGDLPMLPLSAQVRHELLLTVKEALNNAVRHSRASELWFRLRLDNGDLVLAVEDNGRGFEANGSSGGGNGLTNMRRRLESIGGTCLISSRPGAGTSIRFRLRLATKPAPGA
jgi:signal transduction histidine kinase/streptogramin lyase